MTIRTSPCGIVESRTRLATAAAYLEVAELVLSEASDAEFSNVAAGLAVLAGIAASDAICCVRLKQLHRGNNHREAAELLQKATPEGKSLATTFLRLLDIKDAAHYGVVTIAPVKAADSIKWANRLVDAARTEVER